MKVVQTIKRLFVYIVTRVLVFDLGLVLLVALTFIFTGNFTPLALSERLLYAGVFVFLIAGTMAMAQMVPGRILMFPYNIRRPEDAKRFVKQTTEFRESAEKRIDAGIQLWLIAFVCLGLSAFVQVFFS